MGDALRASDLVVAHLTIRAFPSNKLLFSTRDTIDGRLTGGADEPLEFVVGRRACLPAVDLMAHQMRVGERTSFVATTGLVFPPIDTKCASTGGRQAGQLWAREALVTVPVGFDHAHSCDRVRVTVHVLQATIAGPSAAAAQALRDIREQREEREKEEFLVINSSPAWTVRIAEAEEERQEAEALKDAGNLSGAVEAVGRGFARLLYTSDEAKWKPASLSDSKLVVRQRGMLHCTRAGCKLRLEDTEGACWDAHEACKALQSASRVAVLRLAASRLRWVRQGLQGLRDMRARLGPASSSQTGRPSGVGVAAEPALGAVFDPELAVVPLLLAAACALRGSQLSDEPSVPSLGAATAVGKSIAEADDDGRSAIPTAAAPGAKAVASSDGGTVGSRIWLLQACAAWDGAADPPSLPAGRNDTGNCWWWRRGVDGGVPVDEFGRLRSGDDVDAAARLRLSLTVGAWTGVSPGQSERVGAPQQLWAQACALRAALAHEIRLGNMQRRRAFANAFGHAAVAASGAADCGAMARPEPDDDDDDMPALEEA